MPVTPFHFGAGALAKAVAPRLVSFSAFVCAQVVIVGGLSHSILDGIMHDDVRPFAPFSPANPLLDLVSLPALHLALVVAGVIGIVVLSMRAMRRT